MFEINIWLTDITAQDLTFNSVFSDVNFIIYTEI